MRDLINDHAAYVKVTVNSVLGQTLTDPVSRSWRRCIREYGLDPGDEPEIALLKGKELRRRQERQADVLAISKSELRSLYDQIAGSGFAVMIADSDAVIVDFVADADMTDVFSKYGLCLGAKWDENSQGTNAMGTCLIEREPLIVHQRDHFLPRNVELTCSSAPVFDQEGKVIAVLNASGRSEVAQRHTLALVNTSARTIENLLFLHRFAGVPIVRFHERAEFVGRMREGGVAVANDGIILGANRNAIFLLGRADHSEIVGKNFDDVFKTSLVELSEKAAERAGALIPIYEGEKNRRYFATIRSPEPTDEESNGLTGPKKRQATIHHEHVAHEIMLDELALGDPRMALNVRYVKSVRDREIPILIYGETGTGKEVMARAIHASRDGDRRPFIAVNCAAIPETLIESELFGYAPGAFTGALREGQKGKILQADKGTLFLDEIGDMPLQLQSRLLRVLEERAVNPLGADKSIKVDVTLISATHRDLTELVAAGRFRSDLYYRLQGLMLSLPSLRERMDKRKLIKHMIELESHRYLVQGSRDKAPPGISGEALNLLETYHWPGNIRQLRTVLRVALAVCAGSTITADILPEEIRAWEPSLEAQGTALGKTSLEGAHLEENGSHNGGPIERTGLNAVEEAEHAALLKELEKHHWNIAGVARDLNVSRLTVYRKMKRLGIRK